MFDLMPFERRQNSLFNYFDDFEKNFFGDMGSSLTAFRTDILDKGDKYVLQAELPGFNKEDIHVDIDGDCLTIHAEHKEETEDKKHSYIRRERRYGSFARNFDISAIKADAIEAKYDNGVLELELPKRGGEEKKPQKIEIK